MGLEIAPLHAWQQAKALNQWNKKNVIFPKDKPTHPGTGSFGRFIHDVGYLIELLTDQCTIDPWILAITAVPAFLKAIIAVVEPDLKEAYHEIVGSSLVCTLKQEINEERTLGSWFTDGKKKWLFRTAEIADLAVWRLFLASVTVDGLIDWAMAAQALAGCRDRSPFSAHLAQGGIPDTAFAQEANGMEWLTGFPALPAFSPTIVLQPGQTGTIVYSLSCQAQGLQVPVEVWCEMDDGQHLGETEISEPKEGGGWHHVILHRRFPNTGNVLRSMTIRAMVATEIEGHQAFFESGFCALHTD